MDFINDFMPRSALTPHFTLSGILIISNVAYFPPAFSTPNFSIAAISLKRAGLFYFYSRNDLSIFLIKCMFVLALLPLTKTASLNALLAHSITFLSLSISLTALDNSIRRAFNSDSIVISISSRRSLFTTLFRNSLI